MYERLSICTVCIQVSVIVFHMKPWLMGLAHQAHQGCGDIIKLIQLITMLTTWMDWMEMQRVRKKVYKNVLKRKTRIHTGLIRDVLDFDCIINVYAIPNTALSFTSILLSRLSPVNYSEHGFIRCRVPVCWLRHALSMHPQRIANSSLLLIKCSQALNPTYTHILHRHALLPMQDLIFIQLSACLSNLKQLRGRPSAVSMRCEMWPPWARETESGGDPCNTEHNYTTSVCLCRSQTSG